MSQSIKHSDLPPISSRCIVLPFEHPVVGVRSRRGSRGVLGSECTPELPRWGRGRRVRRVTVLRTGTNRVHSGQRLDTAYECRPCTPDLITYEDMATQRWGSEWVDILQFQAVYSRRIRSINNLNLVLSARLIRHAEDSRLRIGVIGCAVNSE